MININKPNPPVRTARLLTLATQYVVWMICGDSSFSGRQMKLSCGAFGLVGTTAGGRK